jgi:hypothetical protein
LGFWFKIISNFHQFFQDEIRDDFSQAKEHHRNAMARKGPTSQKTTKELAEDL